MPTTNKGIVRSDVEALIETQVANEIFDGVIKESKAYLCLENLLI